MASVRAVNGHVHSCRRVATRHRLVYNRMTGALFFDHLHLVIMLKAVRHSSVDSLCLYDLSQLLWSAHFPVQERFSGGYSTPCESYFWIISNIQNLRRNLCSLNIHSIWPKQSKLDWELKFETRPTIRFVRIQFQKPSKSVFKSATVQTITILDSWKAIRLHF